jgi:hypothetical protein
LINCIVSSSSRPISISFPYIIASSAFCFHPHTKPPQKSND